MYMSVTLDGVLDWVLQEPQSRDLMIEPTLKSWTSWLQAWGDIVTITRSVFRVINALYICKVTRNRNSEFS